MAGVERPSWGVIDKYFAQGGGTDAANPLVAHQIDSFNEFIDKKLQQVIRGFNPINVYQKYDPIIRDFGQKITISVLNPSLGKPMFQMQDGTKLLMTPHLARLNNMTYSTNMYVDVHVICDQLNDDGVHEKIETTIKGVPIGKLPIMVRSKACVLQQMPGLAEGDGKHECKYDPGGYCIVNGNEKCVIAQDRISENKTLVFDRNPNDGLSAEIRSIPDNLFLPPKTTILHLNSKANHIGRTIRLMTNFIRSEIPVCMMFRALGVVKDKDILQHIVLNIDDPKHQRIIAEFGASIEDGQSCYTQDEALKHMLRILGITGTPREYLEDPEQAKKILLNVIKNDFLPHVGPSFARKAVYLGYMIRKLLRIYLGYQSPDNRDSYMNKRIDTPGVLFGNLFRQCYGKMIKEMRNMVQRDLQLWRANKQMTTSVITNANVHRFFKQATIESGMKYALSTGNWGVKTLGGFSNIRQGVAQVLSRMSYLSTISHVRRVNATVEKAAKLIQPRKLEISQFGMICPAETPEGAGVGLVKNMAMTATITTAMSSANLRKCVIDYGLCELTDTMDIISRRQYLLEMGNGKVVMVFVNGDLMGFHRDPTAFFKNLKHLKLTGEVPPTTSIVWDVQKDSIIISTEAGRMCLPLHIVDTTTRRLRIDSMSDATFEAATFTDLMVPSVNSSFSEYNEEGVIEYLDVEEIDKCMVAMTQKDLARANKGTTLPPKFTHCEIHPSLISGVLAANIPFSDHNQAPRNCYQCLKIDEPVLMADGTKKEIQHVRPGDQVITFNLDTMLISVTTVVHQYVRPTSKVIRKLVTISGKTITVTDDHKIMCCTIDEREREVETFGWVEAGQILRNRQLVGIQLDPNARSVFEAVKNELNAAKALGHRVYATDFLVKGDLIFMKVVSDDVVPNCMIADITVESENHSFIGGDGFAVSNSSMGKQAVCTYMSNFTHRMDTMAHVLNYPQKALVRTRLSTVTHSENLPAGINAVIAIMTYTGFNMEDSVMLNQSALDRGLFASTYYRTYKDQCNKNHSTGEEEEFCIPSVDTVSQLKPFNYGKVGPDGFVPINTPVDGNDIIVGKVMPNIGGAHSKKKVGANGTEPTSRDASMHMKGNETGTVDYNYVGVNNEGYKFCKVRLRQHRKPQIGDKFSSRHGQKGSLGMTYKQEDMPFSKDGIVPDIIINPHAIPSRMTIGQLLECIMGKAACAIGSLGDGTPFTDVSVKSIGDVLQTMGMERTGNEILYNGRTGEQIHTEIFMGPTFYQRLKHMIVDKTHSRGSNGPVTLLTRQPTDGRSRCVAPETMILIETGYVRIEHLEDQAVRVWNGDEYSDTVVRKTGVNNKLLTVTMTDGCSMRCTPYHKFRIVNDNGDGGSTIVEAEFLKAGMKLISFQAPHGDVGFSVKKQYNGDYKVVPFVKKDLTNSNVCVATVEDLGESADTFCFTEPKKNMGVFNGAYSVNSGGLRLGEMEVHALISHAASGFIKERMIDSSDNYRVFICRKCGLMATVNPEKNLYRCNTCRGNAEFAQVRIPYSCKLLFQELEALNIAPRIML